MLTARRGKPYRRHVRFGSHCYPGNIWRINDWNPSQANSEAHDLLRDAGAYVAELGCHRCHAGKVFRAYSIDGNVDALSNARSAR